MKQDKIGALIAQLRKEKKMTQEQLAELLDVSNRSVSRWETAATMPDLPMFYRISEVLDVSLTELLNGERISEEEAGGRKERIDLVIRLSEEEKMRKVKKLNRYFFLGLVCMTAGYLHERYGILSFIHPENLREFLAGVLLLLGLVFEFAGFYVNGSARPMTIQEAEAYMKEKKGVFMMTAREMLQFARRRQKAEFRQYEKAFAAIEEQLLPEETAEFSMVAESYTEDEISGGLWHLGIAVTQKRLLIGGEKVAGRIMTRYRVDEYELSDILSVSKSGRKLAVNTKRREIKLEGEDVLQAYEELKNVIEKNQKAG